MTTKIARTVIGLLVLLISACSAQVSDSLNSKTVPAQTETTPFSGSAFTASPATDEATSSPEPPVKMKNSETPSSEPPVASQPAPGEPSMQRAGATIKSVEMLQRESFPKQIALNLSGVLPTPCHQVKADVHKPDRQNRIEIDVYSLVDPAAICAQVLAPFELQIDLGSYPAGKYIVIINAEEYGRFEMP